jgi:hypothetical protein
MVIDNMDEAEGWAVKQMLIENRSMLHQYMYKILKMKPRMKRARTYLERHGI